MESSRRATLLLGVLAVLLGVALAGCTSLEGTSWVLVELDGAPLPAPAGAVPVSLSFDPSRHRVSGTTGVNRLSGEYRRSGEEIAFGPLMVTRRAGPPAAMAYETTVLQALASVARWRIDGGRLELSGGGPLLRFAPE